LEKDFDMAVVNKFMMLSVAVRDMPKAKEFYVDKLGLEVRSDFRQDDDNWWVSLTMPEGGVTVTLTTNYENMQPGTMKLYLTVSDAAAASKELSGKDTSVSDVKDDLYGPGSGVKWCSVSDPEGNQLLLVQA
jgi:catechol 2,3-dioxygenase-like lactoylglutathione lyase family enzyme